MKRSVLLLISIVCLACPAFAQQAPAAPKSPAAAKSPAEAKPAGGMELYLEAMDGQGWQWFFLADTVRRRLDAAELRVYPLVSQNSDGTFSARRGETELAEALRLAVLAKAYPGKLLNYLNARSMSPSADGWRDAALFAGINPDELEKRAASEGAPALAAAYKKSSGAGVTETALFLGGKRYEGSQRLMPLYEAVNASLPAARRAPLPAGYTPKPKLPPPGFWVVVSSGVDKNDALVGVFDRYFEGIKPAILDYGSAERAARFPALEFVPSYILAATPEARIRLDAEIKSGLFKEAGGYLVYEDRQRRGLYAGRPEKKNTLEIFVMSQCPYGVMAENAVLEAEKNKLLPEGLKVEIHFIGDAKKDDKGAWAFSSLHGQAEWEENARQIFIAEKSPDKFNAYLLERNKEITSPDWQKAAKSAGIDSGKVTAGSEEAKDLLAANFTATGALGITTSPSFMVDGKHFVVGLGELAKMPGFEKIPPPGQPAAGCAK
ncbi:MAG: thioredoxin domain-containing protein [Elusimicrobiota bacterium]|nr:thioredoxin domain-containing protein [Elusimicrobiota bacterium]